MKKKLVIFTALFFLSACSHNAIVSNTAESIELEKSGAFTFEETVYSVTEIKSEPSEEIEYLPITDSFQAENIHGSASYIGDKTVIVSILGYDPTTEWDYSNIEDNKTIYKTLAYLETATDWLSEQVKNYGEEAEFIYNWEEDPELIYGARFYEEMEQESTLTYFSQRTYIENNIKSDNLLKKYDAENIIYMFFFNTDFSNTVNPFTMPNPFYNGEIYEKEIINIFVRFDDIYIAPPATYAHEILHTFGAHDLYYESCYINKDYVTHCTETNSRDIMFTVDSGDMITNILSKTDAYYLGLADYSADVEKWGLSESEFE